MTEVGHDGDGEADASAAVPLTGETDASGAVLHGDEPGTGAAPPPPRAAPARVRVTAPRARPAAGAVAGATQAPGPDGALDGDHAFDEASVHGGASTRRALPSTDPPDATDVQGVYVRSLIRSQLRLALICAAGFAVATAAFVFAIAWTPALDVSFIAGVPVSWLLLAVGVYPLALTIAALYVRAATRNEARYRSLAEET